MTTKVYKIFLAISIACFALSSVSVMLILADNIKESLKPLIISTIFWGGLIIGLIFTFLIGKYRKNEICNSLRGGCGLFGNGRF